MSFIDSEIPRVRLPSGATQNGLNSEAWYLEINFCFGPKIIGLNRGLVLLLSSFNSRI